MTRKEHIEILLDQTIAIALTRLRYKVATLFDAIKHGDEAHQAWLKKAIEDHFRE